MCSTKFSRQIEFIVCVGTLREFLLKILFGECEFSRVSLECSLLVNALFVVLGLSSSLIFVDD